ncbi:uncharacterized protein BT62DRAFT_1077172 [Guyanagaster necrorhizus]|uniref:Chitinase n=1 Tax=Guyanagaster necrorhizus TaxID=856835 RepID=A0A9P7VQW4_9AGAR|nr:uncharacterized protein BT62DRAFT_1077172 [Guyanagaster necrorhizus MCA 3950]KAG7444942.1 hypothetical protein BT62DRAFT_1077172 [Guyanagaster necrorhizus MCA 3950]
MAGVWDKAAYAALNTIYLFDDERTGIKSQYAAAGVKLLVSIFGSFDVPTTSRADPTATADTMAAWVSQYNLDGIDADYEDFAAFDAGDGKAEQWLADFTTRNPSEKFIHSDTFP